MRRLLTRIAVSAGFAVVVVAAMANVVTPRLGLSQPIALALQVSAAVGSVFVVALSSRAISSLGRLLRQYRRSSRANSTSGRSAARSSGVREVGARRDSSGRTADEAAIAKNDILQASLVVAGIAVSISVVLPSIGIGPAIPVAIGPIALSLRVIPLALLYCGMAALLAAFSAIYEIRLKREGTLIDFVRETGPSLALLVVSLVLLTLSYAFVLIYITQKCLGVAC